MGRECSTYEWRHPYEVLVENAEKTKTTCKTHVYMGAYYTRKTYHRETEWDCVAVY